MLQITTFCALGGPRRELFLPRVWEFWLPGVLLMSLYGYICCELFAVIDCFYVDIIYIDWIYNYYWFILYSENKTF